MSQGGRYDYVSLEDPRPAVTAVHASLSRWSAALARTAIGAVRR